MDARHLYAQKVIVIHPGSLNLRIGRAADLHPITILNAVGYKIKPQQQEQTQYHRDALLPPMLPEMLDDFEEQRQQAERSIRAGGKRQATSIQKLAAFNKDCEIEELVMSKKERLEEDIKTEDVKYEHKPIFDQDIMRLSADAAKDYNIHFPMRRGELHLHDGVGGSLSAVLAYMEAIYCYAIIERLGIAPHALAHYSAVLVIPDVYQRSYLREFVSLLLQRLGFRAVFLVQDHVAATFGTGLGYACVVDVGDQKCSISCVEDGISQPDTRVRLAYGGSDVTQVFYLLLQKINFPYTDIAPHVDYADATLLMKLRERCCHLQPEIWGATEHEFEVQKSHKLLRYTMQMGDQCLIAPLSLFMTELLDLTGKHKAARLQQNCSQQVDVEDCFDAEYIRETGRRNGGRDQEGAMPVTGDAIDEELVVVDAEETALNLERDVIYNARNFSAAAAAAPANADKTPIYMPNDQIASIDLAIVRSIESCASEELKRKMYGCILLVGGGIKIAGFAKFLENKIVQRLVTLMNLRSHEQLPFEVNTFVKEMDAAIIAWKGAAIMSCLESAAELWITADEWQKCGIRILREKAPFIW